MDAYPQRPPLRLVAQAEPDVVGVIRRARAVSRAANAGRAVAGENRAAAGLSAGDARRVFAVQVAGQLEGGRAAVLTAERRRRLLRRARGLGLRAFDANLIIAVVQDEARRGADTLAARAASELLGVVGSSRQRPSGREGASSAGRGPLAIAVATVLLAAFGAASMAMWVLH